MSYRNYANTNGFIVAQNNTADFTTITAAIAAINAKGIITSRIYLTDLIYTENFTVPSGCTISAIVGANISATTQIDGKITYSGGTSCTIASVRLRNTSGDYCITSSAGEMRLINVGIVGSTFDIAETTGTGQINAIAGEWNLIASNIAHFQSSGTRISFYNTRITNQSGSIKPSEVSYGIVEINNCSVTGVFESSEFGIFNIQNSSIDNTGINATPLISGGNGDYVANSLLDGNAQPALTITSNCTISTCTLFSNGTNAISGNGTLIYSDLTFTGSSSSIQSTITKSLLTTGVGKITLGNATVKGAIPYVNVTNGPLEPLNPGDNGDLLQLNNGVPTWTTPSFPITVGNTGSILRSDGTNWAATTATYPATTTINQVLYSSAANTITGLATANSAVLATNGSGVPSLTATPTITSVTFGAGTALSSYVEGTWTPTINGGTVSGTTTYTIQQGYYTRIGNMVTCQYSIAISAATGTGNAIIDGLPFTVKNQTSYFAGGSIAFGGTVWAFPVTTTSATALALSNTTTTFISCSGTLQSTATLQMFNGTSVFRGTIIYQI